MSDSEFIYCPDCLKLYDELKKNPGGPSVCSKCLQHLDKMAEDSPMRLMPLKNFEKYNFLVDEVRKLSRRIDNLEAIIKDIRRMG